MTRQVDDGLILQGDVYIRNRRIDGAGFVHIGNTTQMELTSATEKKERISKQKETFGQALDSISTPKPVEISFALDTFDRHNLALALMGQDADLQQAAGTFTADVVIGSRGQWYAIGKTLLDKTAAITVEKDGTALDSAVFEINYDLGLIKIADNSSTVADGDTVSVSGSLKESGGFTIAAAKLNDFDLEIKLDGKNQVNEQSVMLHIPSAVIAADGAIDWFGDDFATANFKGTLVATTGQDPYTVTVVE